MRHATNPHTSAAANTIAISRNMTECSATPHLRNSRAVYTHRDYLSRVYINDRRAPINSAPALKSQNHVHPRPSPLLRSRPRDVSPLLQRRKTRRTHPRHQTIPKRSRPRPISLRSPHGIHRLPIHLRQSRRHHFRPRQSSRRQRPPSHPRKNVETQNSRPSQSRPVSRKSLGHERSRRKNSRRYRPHARASRTTLRRRTRRTPRLRPRHRRLDRRNVFNFQSWPPRRAPHPRPGRKKGLVGYLRQKAHAQAQRTPRLWRTLASLSHHRELV